MPTLLSHFRKKWIAVMAIRNEVTPPIRKPLQSTTTSDEARSEEHTSELQSRPQIVCRLLLEKTNKGKSKHSGMFPNKVTRDREVRVQLITTRKLLLRPSVVSISMLDSSRAIGQRVRKRSCRS